jgi:hypothetical protein
VAEGITFIGVDDEIDLRSGHGSKICGKDRNDGKGGKADILSK